MRFLFVLVCICLLVALLSIPFFILFDDNNYNIDEDSTDFIYISNQKIYHSSGDFNIKIFEDSKTGVQYILFKYYNQYGYSVSPRYNADGTLFISNQQLGEDN